VVDYVGGPDWCIKAVAGSSRTKRKPSDHHDHGGGLVNAATFRNGARQRHNPAVVLYPTIVDAETCDHGKAASLTRGRGPPVGYY